MNGLLLTVLITLSFNSFAYDITEGEDSVPTIKAKAKDKDLKHLIESRQYSEALGQLDKAAVAESHIGIKIVFDVLYVLVNKNRISGEHEFFCEPQYLGYPNAVNYSYSMQICKTLIDYAQKKSISSKSYDGLHKFVKKNSKHKLYLVEALEELVK